MSVSRADLDARGVHRPDFIIVSGDAYIDHPSFAAALLGRLLEAHGFSVGVIPQPDWRQIVSFAVLGPPRLAFLVSAGAMDSLVCHYTANNKPRSNDVYSPNGETGHRPDRAIITYCGKIREAFHGAAIIIGGIEASMRRFAHYDYWSDTVRRSVLLDSKADILVYGMGERAILEIARRLDAGEDVRHIRGVRGTCVRTGRETDVPGNALRLPSFAELSAGTMESRTAFARSYLTQEENTDHLTGRILAEQSDDRFVIQEMPALPLSTPEFDAVMELPYTRQAHPRYAGSVDRALQEVLFSLVSVRGCFGACSFCAIAFHQGKHIQVRSHESLEREARLLTALPGFKGYIHDVGGPTANFRLPPCARQVREGSCRGRECLGSEPCPALRADHGDYLSLLRRLRAIPGIKKVFVRSGLRFDYLMADPNRSEFLRELCEHHVSGQLKVAPEHVNSSVLGLVRKSSHGIYEAFAAEYAAVNRELGKKQYLVPYYIASLPGATVEDARENSEYLRRTGFVPDQVQDFYPTPGTLAACQYYTALDPHTVRRDGTFAPIHVPKGRERRLHRALLQFNRAENAALVGAESLSHR